jgi:hypothetical protein
MDKPVLRAEYRKDNPPNKTIPTPHIAAPLEFPPMAAAIARELIAIMKKGRPGISPLTVNQFQAEYNPAAPIKGKRKRLIGVPGGLPDTRTIRIMLEAAVISRMIVPNPRRWPWSDRNVMCKGITPNRRPAERNNKEDIRGVEFVSKVAL